MQNLATLHTYYVTNAKTELKVAAQDMSDDTIFKAINNINSDYEFDDEDENEDEQESENDELMFDREVVNDDESNEMEIEHYFDFLDRELANLLRTQEVQVIIEPKVIDHGDREFDLEELLERNFDD